MDPSKLLRYEAPVLHHDCAPCGCSSMRSCQHAICAARPHKCQTAAAPAPGLHPHLLSLLPRLRCFACQRQDGGM